MLEFERFRSEVLGVLANPDGSQAKKFRNAVGKQFTYHTPNPEYRDNELQPYLEAKTGFKPKGLLSGVIKSLSGSSTGDLDTAIALYYLAKIDPVFRPASAAIENCLFGKLGSFESKMGWLPGRPQQSSASHMPLEASVIDHEIAPDNDKRSIDPSQANDAQGKWKWPWLAGIAFVACAASAVAFIWPMFSQSLISRNITGIWGERDEKCAVTYRFDIKDRSLILRSLKNKPGMEPLRIDYTVVADEDKPSKQGERISVLDATETKGPWVGQSVQFIYKTDGSSERLEWKYLAGDRGMPDLIRC